MQFWQSLFLCEADQIFDVTATSQDAGFYGMLISDHLVHPETQDSVYPYSEDGAPPQFTKDTAWPESWSLCSALAALNEKLHFCTNVYILPLRNPIELARATSSAAYFSGGRIHIGAGAGWMKEEFDLLGVDFETRGARYDECIEVIRKLYSGDYVEHHGEFFDFSPIMMNPVPAQPVPILIGGISKPALRRAARMGDGWIGPGQSPQAALDTLQELEKLRREYGTFNRDFDIIVPLFGENITVDDIKRLRDAGATGMVSLPFNFVIGPGTTLQQKQDHLHWYADNIIAKVNH